MDLFTCSKCEREIKLDLKLGLDKPVQNVYYDEKTFEVICKECYKKSQKNIMHYDEIREM